jgi:transcriptional regulator with XRE-family HTH domain
MMASMVGREPDIGNTAWAVGRNVTRLRESQNLTYTQLSERLKQQCDWSINAVGIRRIEDLQRRVTVDDLIALALALGVSPITLLMPDTKLEDQFVQITGVGDRVRASALWEWLSAENALPSDERVPVMFHAVAWPAWKFAAMVADSRQKQADHLKRRRADKARAGDGDDR